MNLPQSKLSDDLFRAFWCFALGVVAPACAFSLPTGLVFFPIFFIFGAILGLPALVVILILVVSFRPTIHRHLGAWCFVAPFLTVIVTAIFALAVIVVGRGFDESVYGIFRELDMPSFLATMFLGSALSAGLFYHWTQKAKSGDRGSGPETIEHEVGS